MELTPGRSVGAYRLGALLGRGGMGAVYRAVHTALDRPVALKVIRADHAGVEMLRTRFRREARLAASLEHPHVVPVFDAGEADGVLYIAMRLIEGADLRSELRARRRLDPARAVRVLGEVASALDAAHAAGLVHRDVKPGNVLLETLDGGDERAYLADFGLTRMASSTKLTATGRVMGTLDYVAPEQLRGEAVDGRADVYALGCVLFELLSGQVPFVRDSDGAKVWAHMSDPPPRPSQVDESVPVALDEVCARAMAKQPGERFASAGALAQAAATALGSPDAGLAATELDAGLPRVTRARGSPRPPTIQRGGERPALPHRATSVLGRESQLTALRELFEVRRLVTLTGPGGTGKTTLALEFARRSALQFPGGVFFCELAAILDVAAVGGAIVKALGQPGRGGADRAWGDALADALGEPAPVLLVLDNLEHLPGVDAPVSEILALCPSVRVLATSRAPLRLRAEQELRVSPLPTVFAAGGDPLSSPAAQLFVERARAVTPRFDPAGDDAAAVAAIVARVDGLPLAIELAAARARALAPRDILPRLEHRLALLVRGAPDLPERQRTMSATINWSHDLLSPPQRDLFARLAVFPSGFPLDAAEALMPERADVFDLLEALVEQGLVEYGERRYFMLQTVLEYARERLEASGSADDARRRMAAFYADLADQFVLQFFSGDQFDICGKLDAELANIRAIMAGGFDPEPRLRIAAGLFAYMEIRGNWTEARRWLTDALAAAPSAFTPPRLLALSGLCSLASLQGDVGAVNAEAAELRSTLPTISDPLLEGHVCAALMLVAIGNDELDEAERYGRRGIAATRGIGDLHAALLNNLGTVAMRRGRLDHALTLFEEAVELAQRAEIPGPIALLRANIGIVLLALGDVTSARRSFADAYALARQHRDLEAMVYALAGLGWSDAHDAHDESAARLLGTMQAALARQGQSLDRFEAALHERVMAGLRERLGRDELARLLHEGGELTLEDVGLP